jgi:enamine deaminase RidA (YjgF/YER057c/UK114 family)
VLGPDSVHARAAVGVSRLPLDAPVEVEAMFAMSA